MRIGNILGLTLGVTAMMFTQGFQAFSAEPVKTQVQTATSVPATTPSSGLTPPTNDIPISTSDRGKSLSFEDELIEGMNRNPFDSLTSASKKDMRETVKLYRVKSRFSLEIRLTSEEMGYSQ